MEKLALALVSSARKLRPYFQGHSIHVLTSHLFRQVLQNPKLSGRIAKWAVELGEFNIKYIPRTAVKAQALADFVVEFTGAPESTPKNPEKSVDVSAEERCSLPDQSIENGNCS